MNGKEIRVDVTKLKDVVCECKSKSFVPVYSLKNVPALLSPSGHADLIAIQGWECRACGKQLTQIVAN